MKESETSVSTVDLDLYQDSSGFIHMNDEKEYRWGDDTSSLGHSRSSTGTHSHSRMSQDHDHSDHVFYVVRPQICYLGDLS